MEESLKNRAILILSILAVIFFLGAINSCANARHLKISRDKEIATRLDLEEKLGKSAQEKQSTEKSISDLGSQLEEEKAAHQATKKALVQEQLVSQSLKEELEKVVKLKEALEEDLKESLTKNKAKK